MTARERLPNCRLCESFRGPVAAALDLIAERDK